MISSQKKSKFFLIFFLGLITLFMTGLPNLCVGASIGTQEISFQIPDTDRWLAAEVYYPVDQQRSKTYLDKGIWHRQSFIKDGPLSDRSLTYPLVIFSHGWQGDRFGNSWIAESLVEKGYIVVMIDHTHNTNYDHSDLFVYTSPWQRPIDMSYLLTYLLHRPQWEKLIDKNRIVSGGGIRGLNGLMAWWNKGKS